MKQLLLIVAIFAVTGTNARMVDPALIGTPRSCNAGNFQCDNGLCIPGTFVCDGIYDCTTGNDETSCGAGMADPALIGTPRSCNAGNFQCDNGLCIPGTFVCDGIYDCTTGNDETSCGAEHVAASQIGHGNN